MNNDENLAIFSNNMHNLCRLNNFLSHGFSTFKADFFCLAWMQGAFVNCFVIFHMRECWKLLEVGWEVQFHKKYPENISLHQPDKFLLLWVNNKNKSETVFLVPSQNHSYNSTMYSIWGMILRWWDKNKILVWDKKKIV